MSASAPRTGAPRRIRFVAATLATTLSVLQLVSAGPAGASGGTFGVDNATRAEPGDVGYAQMAFTVTRTGFTSGPATLDYTTVAQTGAGKATAGEDYLATSGSAVFAGNETSKQVTVDLLGDSLNEGDETFILRFSGATGETLPGGTLDVTGTITDDNDPAPVLSVADASRDEGDAGSGLMGFVVTLSAPSGRVVTVNYATADGTAVAPADYTSTSGTLTFDPGQLSRVVPASVIGDSTDEADETFALNLSDAVNAGIRDGAARGLILDDDGQPSVSVNDVVTANENGKATFKVTLSNPSGRAVSVQATTANGTATAGSDFESTSKRLDFPPGVTSQDFEVPLLDDNRDEPAETFTVVLSATQNALLGDAVGVGTITDDDAGPNFSVDDVTAPEGEGLPSNFRFTVRLEGAVPAQVYTVRYTVKEGTATSPADYTITPPSGTLTFLSASPQTVSVLVVDDSLAEGTETFTVELSDPSPNATIGKAVGLGTILNDDGPPAVVSVNDVSQAEDLGPAVFNVTLSGPVNQAVTVSYTTQDGTATAGRDYTPRSGTLVFAPNELVKTISVPTSNDALNEADETFTLELSNPVNAVFADSSATGTILNDDPLPVVSVESISIDEGNDGPSSATVAVTLSAESGREVRVNYAPADGTAIAGLDYSADPATTLVFKPGTIGPGETVKLIHVAATGDTLDEIDETFTVGLSGAINATIGQAVGVVTITDDDLPPVITIDGIQVEEPSSGTRDVSFAVHLSAPSGKTISVNYATADGTASQPSDYTQRNGTLAIPAGQLGGSVAPAANQPIRVKADGADEPNETFLVNLSSPVNAGFRGGVATIAGTGTILDIDGPPALTITGTTLTEGNANGTANVTVNLLPSSASAVTVHYDTADGTAVNPGDYTRTGGDLTFAPGDTFETIPVPVMGDRTDEADEIFTVTLSNESGATVSGSRSAQVGIIDDDGPAISVADIIVTEGDTGTKSASFVVSLSAPSPQAISVDYATSNGTARSPGDYAKAAGTLNFAVGESSKPVNVTIVGDTIDEGDEDFTLGLSNPTKAAIERGVARATIVDNDQPSVTVSVSSGPPDASIPGPRVNEGDFGTTAVTFTMNLSTATVREASLDYATVDGTARGGSDFLPAAGRISFAPGETAKSVVVTVAGDSRNERDETFSLRLSDPKNLKAPADTLATILDDDKAGYALVASDGGIFAFGGADFAGSTGNIKLNQPIVGMASTPSGRGYWMVASDGGIFAFGDARFHGSTGAIKLNKPVVGMASTPTGKGYWLVASDGGVFSFGDAKFFGSTGAIKLNQPIVGMSTTDTGKGYWMVASDGGIFAFGDAKFLGSTGAIKLNRPIVGMATTDTGKGYWLVASDGGVFSFGDARFFGSTGAIKLNQPIVGMSATGTGAGYWMVASDGGIFSFGDAKFLGSTGDIKLNRPIVGMVEL